MPEALRDIADISFAEGLFTPAPMRTEKGHTEITAEHILPLGGIRMPMKFSQSARFHLQHDPCHGGGNGKLRAIDTPLNTTVENFVRLLGEETVFVG